MNMKKRHHRQRQGGFTISEVVLAVGVVAFGLVAVLGVLPAGLSVHKDNREETIIRYEAEYWINAIRAGAQQFDALNQVEWAEIRVEETGSPEKVYRAHRNRLGGDGWDGSGNLNGAINRGHLKQIYWPTDVIGWLSIPNGTVKTKTVLVRPLNSTLFDRIYGRKLLVADRSSYNNIAKNSTIYHPLPGGDLAFAYLLEVKITKPDPSLELHKVELTFRWPVLNDPTIENPTKDARHVKTISKMVFPPMLIAGALESAPAINQSLLFPPTATPEVPGSSDYNATRRYRFAAEQILSIMLPGDGEEKTVDELESLILAPRLTLAGPVVRRDDDYYIQTDEIVFVLNKLRDPPYRIMEEVTGSFPPADQIWSMRRQPYSGYGHYSMRPMPITGTSNGGYEPMWSAAGRFNGFRPPPLPLLPYFSQQYFFTPDNQ
jgi:type II secretory pathway pseudopilin PulG